MAGRSPEVTEEGFDDGIDDGVDDGVDGGIDDAVDDGIGDGVDDEHTGSERTTVWLFITALCVGGAERTLVDLANGLDPESYDVTVWTIFATNPLAEDLRSDVAVRSLSDRGRVENGAVVGATTPLAYVVAPVRFLRAVRAERPDVIHSFLFFDNVLARIAGAVSSATIVTGVRSVPNDPSRVRAIVDRLTTPLSDAIVSNSTAGRDLAIERGADPDDVSVIANGRDVETYRDADGEGVRRELEIGEGELVVGTVGRLLERKGHFELLSAWKTVQERGIDARLVFVGDGEDGTALKQRADDLGIEDSVEFLGMRDDVPELLATMDVFAFPSHFEGLPGAVIEAMCAGLPIVATPADGTAELIDGYRTGLFVPIGDADPLAWALIRLLETPSLRDTLGEAAQDEAVSEYTIDAMVEQFSAVYRDLETDERITDSSRERVPAVT